MKKVTVEILLESPDDQLELDKMLKSGEICIALSEFKEGLRSSLKYGNGEIFMIYESLLKDKPSASNIELMLEAVQVYFYKTFEEYLTLIEN